MDLNNNEPNQAMRCIREMLNHLDGQFFNQPIEFSVFDVRHKGEIPNLNFDIYLSTGGPGSPFDGEGKRWEADYFRLIDKVWSYNQQNHNSKKYIFFICHSFQIMVRFFGFSEITRRKRQSFGVTDIFPTEAGRMESCFQGLPDPFSVADFRDYQAVQPNYNKFDDIGAKILCFEKPRPHVKLERAITGIRVSPEMIGTQFHPEADALGMRIHFKDPKRKKHILEHHGENTYYELIEGLKDPRKIHLTHQTIIPSFLEGAVRKLRGIDEVVQ